MTKRAAIFFTKSLHLSKSCCDTDALLSSKNTKSRGALHDWAPTAHTIIIMLTNSLPNDDVIFVLRAATL
jgi:hypothetical protein